MRSLWRLIFIAAPGALLSMSAGWAQDDCEQTPEGRICRVQQPIVGGNLVDSNLQQQLGLVTINGGCSGTLLNRWWVLTARHCVQVNGQLLINPPTTIPALLPADQVSVTATWAPGRTGVASRVVELGAPNQRDMVLFYLGRADLGQVNTQPLLANLRVDPTTGRSRWEGQRLATTDLVTQYGQGFGTFATPGIGGAPPTPAGGLGIYRSAQFAPSNITGTGYSLAMNANNQIGHGGDSGGPSVLTQNGVGTGIAGVQSTCTRTGTVAGAPPGGGWAWATGISRCGYVSVEPVANEINRAIREQPYCQPQPGCLMAPVIQSVLKP